MDKGRRLTISGTTIGKAQGKTSKKGVCGGGFALSPTFSNLGARKGGRFGGRFGGGSIIETVLFKSNQNKTESGRKRGLKRG